MTTKIKKIDGSFNKDLATVLPCGCTKRQHLRAEGNHPVVYPCGIGACNHCGRPYNE